jgi:phospholipid/cholesterol/gamma-HCH transport system substrate-binding protein
MEIRARYVLMGLFAILAIAVGFVFVYWMNNAAGFSRRVTYRVEFSEPVSGLLRGSAVLFNGIRVGEVSALRLDPSDANRVSVDISVDPATPVRVDTNVGLAFQGLTGGAAIAMSGGSGAPARGTDDTPAKLVAAPGSGQDMTTSARQVLKRLDTILADNSEPVKSAIANINTFSAALARNADKIDGIATGLEKLTGGGPDKAALISLDLAAPTNFGDLPKPDGPIGIEEPSAVVALQGQRVLRLVNGGRQAAFDGYQWSDTTPLLVQARLIQSFENAGFLNVGKSDDVQGGYSLAIDVREFSVDAEGSPVAIVELAAKISKDDQVVGAKVFRAEGAVPAMDPKGALAGFNAAFGKAATGIVGWALGAIQG